MHADRPTAERRCPGMDAQRKRARGSGCRFPSGTMHAQQPRSRRYLCGWIGHGARPGTTRGEKGERKQLTRRIWGACACRCRCAPSRGVRRHRCRRRSGHHRCRPGRCCCCVTGALGERGRIEGGSAGGRCVWKKGIVVGPASWRQTVEAVRPRTTLGSDRVPSSRLMSVGTGTHRAPTVDTGRMTLETWVEHAQAEVRSWRCNDTI